MRLKDFQALTVGDRVIVTGEHDAERFTLERGIIEEADAGEFVTVRFDTWAKGWGIEGRNWTFSSEDRDNVQITVERQTVEEKPAAKKAPTKPKKAPHGKEEYKGNGRHYWTAVTAETKRLRVPGGWLYRDGGTHTMVFVPVPEVVGYAI